MKYIFLALCIIGLSACSNGNDTSVNVETVCNIAPKAGDIILDTSDSTGSIELREKYNVYVASSRTSKTIISGSPIGNFYIQGDNNQLTFETNVTVDVVCMSGADNVLLVPSGSGIIIDMDTGLGNSLVEY